MPRLSNLLFIGAMGLLCGAAAHAQDHPAQAPVPPPPGMNDPGVQAAAPGTSPAPAGSSLQGLPKLPALGGDGAQRDGLGRPAPTMDIRTVGGDKVEEYRVNGQIYMIHVIPEHGVPQTYMANPQGELMRQAGQPPVKPVFYTIYKWGGPKEKKDNGDGN